MILCDLNLDSEGERKSYQREYEMEKAEYYEKVNAYNRSPAYQQYLGTFLRIRFSTKILSRQTTLGVCRN